MNGAALVFEPQDGAASVSGGAYPVAKRSQFPWAMRDGGLRSI